MKTAEEMADKIMERIWEKPGFGEDLWISYRDILAQALTAFADEQLKGHGEDLDACRRECYHRGIEEAAKVVDCDDFSGTNKRYSDLRQELAKEIRALKTKK